MNWFRPVWGLSEPNGRGYLCPSPALMRLQKSLCVIAVNLRVRNLVWSSDDAIGKMSQARLEWAW